MRIDFSSRHFRKKMELILGAFYPSLLLTLAKKNVLKDEHLVSKKVFVKAILGRGSRFIKSTEILVGIEADFVKLAASCWKKRQKHTAVVALATAIEQIINCYLRYMLTNEKLPAEDVTLALKSVNLDAKTGWFLRICAGKPISSGLRRKIKLIAETRNAIVHFKAETSLVDAENGTGDKIKQQIKTLGRLNVLETVKRVEWEYYNLTRESNDHFRLATDAIAKMDEWKILPPRLAKYS